MLFFGFLKAVAKIIGIRLIGIDEIGRYIYDDPFIYGRIIYNQAVDVIVLYQHDIIRDDFL